MVFSVIESSRQQWPPYFLRNLLFLSCLIPLCYVGLFQFTKASAGPNYVWTNRLSVTTCVRTFFIISVIPIYKGICWPQLRFNQSAFSNYLCEDLFSDPRSVPYIVSWVYINRTFLKHTSVVIIASYSDPPVCRAAKNCFRNQQLVSCLNCLHSKNFPLPLILISKMDSNNFEDYTEKILAAQTVDDSKYHF